MRRGRMFLYLALILVVGLVLVYVFYNQFMQPANPVTENVPTPTPVIEMVDVVIVTQRVSRGQALNDSVLDVVPYQRDLFIEGMFTREAEAVGKRARLDMEPGFVLMQNMVTDLSEGLASAGSDAALLIPRGQVAVSIPISRLSSISYAPRRGDHVNVYVTMLMAQLDEDWQTSLPNHSASIIGPSTGETGSTLSAVVQDGNGYMGRSMVDDVIGENFYETPSEDQRARLVSETLIQDGIVLQVGNFPLVQEVQAQAQASPTPDAMNASVNNSNNEQQPAAPPEPPQVITLIVSPQDAVTLNYLMFSGAKLTLSLRGANDDTRVQTEAVTLQYLLEQYNIPIPIKLPYGMEPRINELILPDTIITPVPQQ